MCEIAFVVLGTLLTVCGLACASIPSSFAGRVQILMYLTGTPESIVANTPAEAEAACKKIMAKKGGRRRGCVVFWQLSVA
jgi:hypothetical protein